MSSMASIFVLLQIGVFAFFTALSVCGLMGFAGVLDRPDHRSSHKKITPTAGGVGLVAALGLGMLMALLLYPTLPIVPRIGGLLALAFGISLLGFIDDINVINTKVKFTILTLICALVVSAIEPPQTLPVAVSMVTLPLWFAFLGALLWMFVITNTANFIDGINGLMGIVFLLAFCGLIGLALSIGNLGLAIVSAVMVAAILGFLPYNFKPKVDIFCGDVGSLLVGFMYGASVLVLVASPYGSKLIYLCVLFVLPIVIDVLITLLYRVLAGKNLLQSHKDHLYQRLTQHGWPPIKVSIVYGVTTFFMIGIGFAALHIGMHTSLFFFLFCVGGLSSVYVMKMASLKKRGQQQIAPDE